MPQKKKAAPKDLITFPDHYIVLGADLSLTRPGFAVLEVDNKNGQQSISLINLSSVNNKKQSQKKSHGEILSEIRSTFLNLLIQYSPVYLVREHEIMHMKLPSERSVTKVVGLMDYLAYVHHLEWHEIYPVTVKSLVAGSGKAEKSEVAKALSVFVGEQEYQNDDESDAAAVAVAWLIQQNQLKGREKK